MLTCRRQPCSAPHSASIDACGCPASQRRRTSAGCKRRATLAIAFERELCERAACLDSLELRDRNHRLAVCFEPRRDLATKCGALLREERDEVVVLDLAEMDRVRGPRGRNRSQHVARLGLCRDCGSGGRSDGRRRRDRRRGACRGRRMHGLARSTREHDGERAREATHRSHRASHATLARVRMAKHKQLRWYAESCRSPARRWSMSARASASCRRASGRRVGETGRVVSVEPLASHVRRLQERIAECAARNWIVEACATSDHGGEVALVTAKEGDVWSSVVRAARHAACTGAETRGDVSRRDDREARHRGPRVVVLDDALSALPHVQAWSLELHMIPGRPLQGVLRLLPEHGLERRIAGRTHSDPHRPWRAVAVPSSLDWSASRRCCAGDGEIAPGLKTIHTIAKREW
jgi:hypothetical protein